MSNEKKVPLIAVHEVHLGADAVVAPGKDFSTDEKTATYLLSIGAAARPKKVEAVAEEVKVDETKTDGKDKK